MPDKKKLHEIFNNLGISIGEVSKITGVSQRQLRYWEQKGYIKPINSESGVRNYSLATVYLVIHIQSELDEGFTLAAAYKHTQYVKTKAKILRSFFSNIIEDVKVEDEDGTEGKICFGEAKADDKIYQVNAIVNQKDAHLELEEKI